MSKPRGLPNSKLALNGRSRARATSRTGMWCENACGFRRADEWLTSPSADARVLDAMGVLVNAKSEPSFVLEREDFARALGGLKRLAKSLPNEFDMPDGVAKAKTLKDAFESTFWEPRFDAFGDLVGL